MLFFFHNTFFYWLARVAGAQCRAAQLQEIWDDCPGPAQLNSLQLAGCCGWAGGSQQPVGVLSSRGILHCRVGELETPEEVGVSSGFLSFGGFIS